MKFRPLFGNNNIMRTLEQTFLPDKHTGLDWIDSFDSWQCADKVTAFPIRFRCFRKLIHVRLYKIPVIIL